MTSLPVPIRRTRIEAGLSQAELAERAGTSQPALARYETGVALPTLPTLERLLAACGKSLEICAVPANEPPAPTTSLRGRLGPEARELRRHRRRLLEAARTRGVRRIPCLRIARPGEAAPRDLDLLVDLAPGRTLLDLAAFRREAEAIAGVPVDVATPDMLKERIRNVVLADAVPL